MTDTLLDPESALLYGMAQLLDAAGVATWQPDELYGPDVAFPVTLDVLPPGRAAVALRITNDVPLDRSSTRYSVQALLRTVPGDRGKPSAVRNVLGFLTTPPMPPGIRCTSIRLTTRGLIRSASQWDEHSLNFVALCARASAWADGATY